MKVQVFAAVLLVLVASANCQAPAPVCPFKDCKTSLIGLFTDVQTFVNTKDFSNIQTLMTLYQKLHVTLATCKSAVHTFKTEHQLQSEGISLNMNCIKAIYDGIKQVQAIKKDFKAGLDFNKVLNAMINAGLDVKAIKDACK